MGATDHQARAVANVMRRLFWNDAPLAMLAGAAGTGKSYCLALILEELANQHKTVALVAPTGKAARRMMEATGKPASTIHSYVFTRVMDDEEDGSPIFADPHIADPPDVLVVDEASMVGAKLLTKILEGLGRNSPTKILAVGDPFQLPPVKDIPAFPLHLADGLLTEVVRQAADSPVLRMATRIRESTNTRKWLVNDDPSDPRLQLHRQIDARALAEWARDQDGMMLTYTNRTRRRLNGLARLPWASTAPLTVQDTLVIERNGAGVVNGDVVKVREVAHDNVATIKIAQTGGYDVFKARVDHPAAPGESLTLRVAPGLFGMETVDYMLATGQMRKGDTLAKARSRKPRVELVPVDYGACLTVHKSQGSQWDAVGLALDSAFFSLVQRSRSEAQRLLYTAVTRAASDLCVGVVG